MDFMVNLVPINCFSVDPFSEGDLYGELASKVRALSKRLAIGSLRLMNTGRRIFEAIKALADIPYEQKIQNGMHVI